MKYQNMKKATHKGMIPVWKNPVFPRIAGLSDAIMKKAKVMLGRDADDELVHSGKVRIVQQLFNEFTEAWSEFLVLELSPLQIKARELIMVISANDKNPKEGFMKPKTSGEIRAAKKAAEMRTAAEQQRKQALEELPSIYEQICTLCRMADAKVKQAEMNANQYLAKYSKATRFAVVEEEIPVVACAFEAARIPDTGLMKDIAALIRRSAVEGS